MNDVKINNVIRIVEYIFSIALFALSGYNLQLMLSSTNFLLSTMYFLSSMCLFLLAISYMEKQ